MKDKGLLPPVGVGYPIWAWYQWEGKRKRRDMRESGYAKRGEKIVQLTIEIDDRDVLLSDFDLFHYVLNYCYLPESEEDDAEFEKEYISQGFCWSDLRNFNIQSSSIRKIRTKIVKSWERIFDLKKEDENIIYGSNAQKSIQATFWLLKIEQVIKTEIFIAR